ncbi:hypothetical protein [Thalassorhabdomicrobium marinisediminis]|uniref:Phosphoadenosine phosphosulfate reductase n=1 Tax=Thalassorhabdomicrobium marinisediminis TaxID=2170577 RepID=A0A2T7G0Q2_9RHOB|nr:hypothetical protein [Thalassorhabdomicrobium marinisediminis]PVA08004.1 hypothetical protein DC363_00445 [Thalassorhabdomicrobium marinisediminis]
MKDLSSAFHYDLDGLNRNAWRARAEEIAEEFGSAERIGSGHTSLFIDAGRTLLVTFESVARVRRANDDKAPLGWSFVQSHGWSSLTLLSDANVDWFRAPALFGYFDRLIDDGFFDDFDQVLFFGAGAAGYAAAAYSVAAPEARVLLIQPQATLDTRRAGWDRRFPQARRLEFTSRFGFAPMMVETASQVLLIYDPSIIEDAMHASLFHGDNTKHFTTPYLGPNAPRALVVMDVLPDLIEQAMSGALTTLSFATLWRARRTHLPYLRTLLHRLELTDDHDRMFARFCRQISAKGNRPLFARKLNELEGAGVKI